MLVLVAQLYVSCPVRVSTVCENCQTILLLTCCLTVFTNFLCDGTDTKMATHVMYGSGHLLLSTNANI